MYEWPLLIFTLLVQASVGLVLFSALVVREVAGRQVGEMSCIRRLGPALLLACVLAGAGLLASVAHLGYPLNAFNALRHIASSWLSREIAVASLYLAGLCLVTLRALLVKRVSPSLLLLVGAIGLVDVYCMAAIYVHSSVITWMHWNTYLMFYGTVVTLGATLGLLVMASSVSWRSDARLAQRLVMSVLACIVFSALVRLSGHVIYLNGLSVMLQQDTSVTFPLQPQRVFLQQAGLRLAGWGLQAVGILLMALTLWRGRSTQSSLVWLACLAVILAEVVARYAFFSLS